MTTGAAHEGQAGGKVGRPGAGGMAVWRAQEGEAVSETAALGMGVSRDT